MSATLCTRFPRCHLASLDKSLGRQHVPIRQHIPIRHRITSHPQRFRSLATVHNPNVSSRTGPYVPRSSAPRIEWQRQAIDRTAIRVTIDGKVHKFPPVLLRDLCSCPRCIDQSTRQKLFVTAEIPLDIQATECSTGPESIIISWGNDAPGYDSEHKSEIPLSTLRNIVQFGKLDGHPIADQDLPRRVFWSAANYSTKCPDIDYESYMHDDSVLLSALQQLQTHGLLFIKSVPEDEKSVETIAERIGPLKTTFYGRTWDVRSVPEAKNVAYTAQNLGFHMDLLYMEQPPHLQLLHCIRSSSAGGASLFTDSFKAALELWRRRRSDFIALVRTKAAFHYDHPESQYYHQFRPVIEQVAKQIGDMKVASFDRIPTSTPEGKQARDYYNPMDFVSSIAWSPPFQAPFALKRDFMVNSGGGEDGEQPWNEVLGGAVYQWHQAARAFHEFIHRPENIYERLMKPGECVIFDNRRVLHARKAFEVGDAGKERWLRGGYIDKDPYLSKLRILKRQNRELEGLIGGMSEDIEQDLSETPQIHGHVRRVNGRGNGVY